MTGWSTLKKLIWLRIIKGGGSALRTVTGSLIHITDALAMPAKALTVNVEPIQAGTGDPSPDNVRPISGRTSATVTRTGKNLLAKPFVFRPVPSTLSDCFFIKAGTYTFSFQSIGSATTWRFGVSMFDKDGNALRDAMYAPANTMLFVDSVAMWYLGFDVTAKTITITFVNDCYTRIWFGSGNTSSDMVATGAQLEPGSSASAYEPYQGNTVAVDWTTEAGTVYGGTIDVATGLLTVDMLSVDFGDLTWTKQYNITGGFSANPSPAMKSPTTYAERQTGFILSCYAADSQVSVSDNMNNYKALRYDRGIYIKDTTYQSSTADDFKTAMSGVQLVYELATPIEITLTPTQIDMLLGTNNLWADAGDLTLTYYADGNASTSEALGILLGGTYNNPGGADDVSDDEALGILLGGS